MRDKNYACGVRFWHPEWLQKYATTKWFLGIYGLLGTVQAMSYMYFVVTLTTIERRFHMPSQTTGECQNIPTINDSFDIFLVRLEDYLKR